MRNKKRATSRKPNKNYAVDDALKDFVIDMDDTAGTIDVLRQYYQDMGQRKLLSAKEEKQLFQRLAKGDESARKEIIEANLRLVINIANRYKNVGMPLIDLIQEGNIGLIKATFKFDLSAGCRFSTYATWWIWQGISRALADKADMIRLPVHVKEELAKYNKSVRLLQQELGRDPTEKEVADKLGMSVKKMRSFLLVTRSAISLDIPVGEDDSSCIGDFVPDTENKSVEDIIIDKELQTKMRTAIEGLKEKEKLVLLWRYGFFDNRVHTLDDIGKRLHLTRERIRQIESGAFAKIRKSAIGRELQTMYLVA